MIDCVSAEVRDALPDLLNGKLSEADTITMREHVASCPSCQAEMEVLREARNTAVLAPEMDFERIASALPAYGGAAVLSRPAAPRPGASVRVWQLAAAAVFVAVAGWAATGLSSRSSSEPALVASTPGALSAPASATTEVPPVRIADSGAAPKSPMVSEAGALSLVAGVQELSDSQIETLISELDDFETVPAAEPQPVTLSIEEFDGVP